MTPKRLEYTLSQIIISYYHLNLVFFVARIAFSPIFALGFIHEFRTVKKYE
jgi:hypothetical protein